MSTAPSRPCRRQTTFHASLLAALLALACPARGAAAVIWVEGEKPTQSTMNRHPWWYDQVKKDHLSGGDAISNFNDGKAGEAEYAFEAPAAGEYEFWVHANPVKSQLSYRLNDGPWTAIDLSRSEQSVNIAADGKPDLRFIAWIKVGGLKLPNGRNTLRFKMHSEMHNHGMLDCFALSDQPFAPKGALSPELAADAAKRTAAEQRDWFAFAPPEDKFAADSGFDLRGLNEPQAGDGGFIAAKDGQFVHSKSGQPVRFWAVNGPPHDLNDRAALRRHARLLAKYGVNMVRIHGGIYDERGTFKPDEVQHKLAMIASMKAEGIYSHLSIYFPLWLKPQPNTPWLEGYDGAKHPFAALTFNRDFQRQYQGWWKALLLTPDAVSGKRLIDEPALAGVEIVNEDSYFFWTFDAKNIPDPQLRLIETQFAGWLKGEFGSLEKALARWGKERLPRDRPDEGRIAFRPLWNIFNQKTPRDRDTARFLVGHQRAFYAEQIKFLRGLGYRGLITCSNWATASPEVFGPLEKYSYTIGDFMDRHGYFGCSHKGQFAEWSVRDGHTYADRSALRFDPEQPGRPKLFVHPVMDIEYDNKPSMISETTFTRPNRYRSEAPLYYACYGALQESDALVHFALDGAGWNVKPRFWMQPWTLMSPAMVGQFPAAAMIYRRGLVAPGEVLVDLNLKLQDLLDLKGTPLPQDAAFDELRLADVPQGAELPAGKRIDPLVHYAGRTKVRFTESGGPPRLTDLRPYIDRRAQVVRSATGELTLDYGKGLLTINAAAAQGVSGTLKAAGPVKLRDLSVESDLDLGHVAAVSLDGQPLARSARILLQVMSEEKNNAFQTEPTGDGGRRIVSIGRDPWMARRLSGTVRLLRPDAGRLNVVALDHAGYPQQTLAPAAEIKLLPTTLYYLVTAK